MHKWLFIVLLFFSLSLQAQERRFLIWNKNSVNVEPWNKISFAVSERMHYSPEENMVKLVYGELSVWHEPKTWLKYGAGFRISYTQSTEGNWVQENRPMLYLNFSKKLNKFKLVFANRFGYRSFEDRDDVIRYKQALMLQFPMLTTWGMKFYISEELFHKVNGYDTQMSRFYVGVGLLEKPNFSTKLYYILQSNKVVRKWYPTDILGINFSFTI